MDTFHYTYSARENQEVLNIRKKYLPREESKLEELKRLDAMVQTAGTTESLIVGISGALVFGLGLCLSMGIIGHMKWLGIILGLLGCVTMTFAYPISKKYFTRAKERYAPRILELTAELTGKN